MPDEHKPLITPQAQQMIINQNLPLLYSNGSSVTLSQSDIQITVAVNGKAASILIMPIPAAKTLLLSLQKGISDYERKTETIVMDLATLAETLKKP